MSYYEFVEDDFKVVDGVKCYRIRATKDFKNTYKEVKKGELGGYVYKQIALWDESWVFGDAVVINSRLKNNSYIIGDYNYRGFYLDNSSINGAGNYLNTCQQNYLTNVEVIGNNFIRGSRHSVIWGVDKTTKKITISVGCQLYTLGFWKKMYNKIAEDKGYNLYTKEYLTYLKRIEESLMPSNEKILEKISSNISSMKLQVTEPLKVETISLVNSLQVSPTKPQQPARDKFGRFMKKVP